MRDAKVERILDAQDRRLVDLYDVRVTVDGPETPDAAAVADQLRGVIAEWEPEPQAIVIGPLGNRRQRRAAARQRRRA